MGPWSTSRGVCASVVGVAGPCGKAGRLEAGMTAYGPKIWRTPIDALLGEALIKIGCRINNLFEPLVLVNDSEIILILVFF